MTTVEKLFAQIFERKKSIIEQLNQQRELYRQYLASKSLIDGNTPPSWLWNPNTSDSEGISEINKDELISKLLCPYPQSSARWSFAHYPGYSNLVTTGDNEEFCDGVSVENSAFCKGLNRQDDPTVPTLRNGDNAEGTLNCVPELDSSVTSPEDRTDEKILNIYDAPDQSLARIKRSKSRQKALELRGSAKTLGKRALSLENAEDVVSSQIRFSLSATNQERQNDELPQLAVPRAVGGQCCEETNLEEADCTSRETGKKSLELQGSERAATSATGVVPSLIRFSFSATDQAAQNDELTQLPDPFDVGGQNCERMNLDEADCTSREQRRESTLDVVSSRIRVSLSATDQAGQNDDLNQLVAEPRAFGGQFCVETNFEEADCTSRETGKKCLELQGSEKAPTSASGIVSGQIRFSLSATDKAGQDDELIQLAEPIVVGGQSCERMSLDEADCSSRELRRENTLDVSSQIRVSLLDIDQAGQNDELTQLVAEPQASGGQCCEEMNFDEAVCASREITEKAVELQVSAKEATSGLRYENTSDVVSSQIRFSLPAADLENQNGELSQLAEPCAVGGQSCKEKNLDEADFTSREMGMGNYSDMVTRSSRRTEVPISVEGSLTLDCSSEDCKENDFSHVAKAKRTESIPISHSEHTDTCINFSKSAGPSDICSQTCGDRQVDDTSFPIEDLETNVCTGKITRSKISTEQQSFGIDSSKDNNSCDKYQGIDISAMDSANNLTPETGDGSLVKVNLPNVCNEGSDTRTSISENSRRDRERDTLPSWSSSQHNICVDAVSDVKPSSSSAKVDGGIHVSSSGVSARQVIDSVEASRSVEPFVGLFRRLTRSQTQGKDKETYQPVANSKNPSFRSPISKPDIQACLEVKVDVCSQHKDSSHRENVLGTHTTIRLQGEKSSLDGSLRHKSMESWPQVKRRKIEYQQANSFTTSPSCRVKKHHSINRGPVSTHVKSMEINANTSFMEHVNDSTNVSICPEMSSSLKEGNLSQHGEVGSCYKEKNENKPSPSDVNNQQLEASLVSSFPLIESRNSGGYFLDGVRLSLSSSNNPFDGRMSGNEQCGEHLCNKEKSADNLISENLKLLNTSLEGIQSPKLEDGLHRQQSVLSPSNEDLQLADVDQSIPVFEGFIIDSQTNTSEPNFVADGFHFDELNLPRTTLERASILAEICRSASLDTPSYQFSSDFEFQGTQNIFQSLPNGGNLEHSDLGDAFPLSSDAGNHLQSGSSSSADYTDTIDGLPYSVPLAYSGARYGWNSRNQYPSPVGKLWDRPSSYTGSSEKSLSSNPELTCFPIEEDPSVSEENKTVDENAGDIQEEINSSLANHCDTRKPLKDLTNLNSSISAEEKIINTDTKDFVSTKFSVTGTQENAHCGPTGSKYHRNKSEVSENQSSYTDTVDVRTNQPSCTSANQIKKAKESTHNSISKPIFSNKTSLKGHDQKLSLRQSTKNNIVSNVSSFIPLVQQKQAAIACAGKRDVKVKALEAAEAAKRLEEKKENERKLRKEAMKLERAKLEEKNLRQMELEKKKKEEERKKKDADIMAKKRLREEEEKKEREKKRMRPDAKQRHREKEEKKRAEKAEKERENHRPKDQHINSKESHDEPKKQQTETSRGDGVALQKGETKLTLTGVMNHAECRTSVITGEVEKAIHSVDRSPTKEDLIAQNSRVASYEISPYQCSDDEDEDDDELPTKKHIPSWASKNSVAMFLPLQQKLDPDVIFPLESFCSMDEVLLPRKLQQSQVAT